jgi:protein ImuB
LRRSRSVNDSRLAETTAAVTRWRITSLPSPPPLREAPDVPGLDLDGLRRLGFGRIDDFMSAPRAPLVKRFGTVLALRLAQALGDQFESIHLLTSPDVIEPRLMFVEPLSTAMHSRQCSTS